MTTSLIEISCGKIQNYRLLLTHVDNPFASYQKDTLIDTQLQECEACVSHEFIAFRISDRMFEPQTHW